MALQSGVLPTLGYSVLMKQESGVLPTLRSGVLMTLKTSIVDELRVMNRYEQL